MKEAEKEKFNTISSVTLENPNTDFSTRSGV